MKILFSSYHAYLGRIPFEAVMRELRLRGVASVWAQMYGTPFDELNQRVLNGVRNEVDTEELHLSRVKPGRLPNLIAAICNWNAIRDYVRRNQFTDLVLSSDTGGVSIRMLQEICRNEQIPVFVLLTVPHTISVPTKDMRRSWPGFFRALLVQPDPVGHYRDATVLVDSRNTRDAMIASGIPPARCIVTGNPVYDSIESHSEDAAGRLAGSLGLDRGTRIVLYIMEALGEVFGPQYTAEVLTVVAEAAQDLPPGFVVVCKPHPRESKEELQRIRERFTGEKFLFTDMADNNLLLAGATLVVGHYSSMLLQAIMSGTPVLSVQIKGEQTARLVFGSSGEFAIRTWDELRAAFRNVSQDAPALFYRLRKSGRATLDTLGIPADKSSAARVADILIGVERRL